MGDTITRNTLTEIHGLFHQRQPTPNTCVQTCLAMALGIPVKHVIAKYGDQPMNQVTLTWALTECGILWNQFTKGTLVYQGWYFAVVPSLNLRGGLHQILLHCDTDYKLSLLDPSLGETYKQDASDLISWSDLTPFVPGGFLRLK